jgi:hypothetical protein
VLENQAGRFGGGVECNVEELDDVGTAEESLENFGFAVDFFDADGFQDFDNTALIVERVDS